MDDDPEGTSEKRGIQGRSTEGELPWGDESNARRTWLFPMDGGLGGPLSGRIVWKNEEAGCGLRRVG